MQIDHCDVRLAGSPSSRIVATGRRLLTQLPLPVLQRLTESAPSIVLYHAVADGPPAHWKHLFPCRDVAGFRRDLDFLLSHFQPVTLAQLVAWALYGEPLPPNAFHLTCDDGLREAVEVIAPLCREKGVPATFFLTTGFLGNRIIGDRHLASLLLERILQLPDGERGAIRAEIESHRPQGHSILDDWNDLLLSKKRGRRAVLDRVAELVGLDQQAWLRTARPYAERQEIERLLADGFTIGAHTVDHPFFPEISFDEQVGQTVDSARQIESLFEISCDAFAFPFGADGVLPEFYAAIQRESAIRLFFGVGDVAPRSGDCLMDRVPMDYSTEVSAESVLRRAYATRLEHRARGIRRDRAAVEVVSR